jgi:hypothetical protein
MRTEDVNHFSYRVCGNQGTARVAGLFLGAFGIYSEVSHLHFLRPHIFQRFK